MTAAGLCWKTFAVLSIVATPPLPGVFFRSKAAALLNFSANFDTPTGLHQIMLPATQRTKLIIELSDLDIQEQSQYAG